MNTVPSLCYTKDGSTSLYHPNYNDYYHSQQGALQESLYIYIENGLNNASQSHLRILEVGFGTGLNPLLTLVHQSSHHFIEFTTIDIEFLDYSIISQLNYTDYLDHPNALFWFKQLHQSPIGQLQKIHQCFHFTKIKADICSVVPEGNIDLIFYDAFCPRVQPEMWALDQCQRLKRWLNPAGKIITYCASSQFKKNLLHAGFHVTHPPGPPGKREMTIAVNV